jgi:hypothetical protein
MKAAQHRQSRQESRKHRNPLIAALVFGTVLAVSGCSVPGLPGPTGAPAAQQVAVVDPTSPAVAPSPATGTGASQSPASTEASAPAAPAWVPVAGDLSRGSVTHSLGAAGHTLIVNYWITDNVATLTPRDAPIIRLSAHIDGSPDGNAIKVTRFNARVDALGAVLANDQGDFAVQPPYSYSSGVVVPANPSAHSTQVLFTFDLLTETEPGSGIFTRQTVLDTVTLGYAMPGTSARN